MKKFLFAALLSTSALAFVAGAHAEGEAAIHSGTSTNTDVSAGNNSADDSYARGTIQHNENGNAPDSISATSTTGTRAGTASGTIDANGNAEGQVGIRDGDDEANSASGKAMVSEDMSTKTGVMKTRAKGAMGMLNPDEIKQVQSNLKSAGYSVSTDGVWGPRTRAALKEYQKSKNLNVSGKMDAETRSSMGFTPNSTNDGGKGADAGGASDMGNQ